VANSLIEACVKVGMHISIACPHGYEPDTGVMRSAKREAAKTGSELRIMNDPARAVKDADAVYTDVWASMGQEAEQAIRVRAFKGYQLNARLMKAASPKAIVMHCLPAHRGEEITADVIDGPQSVVFDEAENRLHTQKAVLEMLMK
jgi:ornithine carbamoyltransferase